MHQNSACWKHFAFTVFLDQRYILAENQYQFLWIGCCMRFRVNFCTSYNWDQSDQVFLGAADCECCCSCTILYCMAEYLFENCTRIRLLRVIAVHSPRVQNVSPTASVTFSNQAYFTKIFLPTSTVSRTTSTSSSDYSRSRVRKQGMEYFNFCLTFKLRCLSLVPFPFQLTSHDRRSIVIHGDSICMWISRALTVSWYGWRLNHWSVSKLICDKLRRCAKRLNVMWRQNWCGEVW